MRPLTGLAPTDVRDSRVPREGLPPGQTLALPGPAVPRLPGGRGPRGRVPQPLVRRAGGLPDRRSHRNFSGEPPCQPFQYGRPSISSLTQEAGPHDTEGCGLCVTLGESLTLPCLDVLICEMG